VIAGGGEEEGWITDIIDLSMVDRVRRELPTLFYTKKSR
jgi:hypothetical protein